MSSRRETMPIEDAVTVPNGREMPIVNDRPTSTELKMTALAALHAATDLLHGTLDRGLVLQIIRSITTAFSGSRDVAIFELDTNLDRLVPVSSSGLESDNLESIPLGIGLIGRATQEGEMYERLWEPDAALVSERRLRACIPLMMDSIPIGAIAIFTDKMVHKPLDRELFTIFSRHAGSALYWTATCERAKAALDANW